MDITKLSETELKSMGYDLVKQAQTIQNDINVIEKELAKRVETEKKPEPKK